MIQLQVISRVEIRIRLPRLHRQQKNDETRMKFCKRAKQLDPLLKADLVGCNDAIAILVMPIANQQDVLKTKNATARDVASVERRLRKYITYLLNQLT